MAASTDFGATLVSEHNPQIEARRGPELDSDYVSHPRLIVIGALVLAAAIFVGSNVPIVNNRFGYSHDGYNGAMWSLGARAIETDGLTASKLGAKNARAVYANHPPAIYVETYLSRRLPIDPHAAARLLAILSSVLAISLLAALLKELRYLTLAIAASLMLVGTSPMFIVFGSMLDTPILGLPICVGALLLYSRAANDRSDPRWIFLVVGVSAALTSWTAVVFVGFTAASLVVSPNRKLLVHSALMPLVTGLVLGLALTSSWIWWVHQSLRPLLENGSIRAGGGVSMVSSVRQQVSYIWDAMPVLMVLGLPGMIMTARSRLRGSVVAAAFLATLLYALAFNQGAFIHQYWNYAMIIPLAIGVASIIQAALRLARNQFIPTGIIVGTATILATGALLLPSTARVERENGFRVAQLFAVIDNLGPEKGPKLLLMGPTISGAPWAFYETGGRSLDFDIERDSLDEILFRHPAIYSLVAIPYLISLGVDLQDIHINAQVGSLMVVPLSELTAR